MIKDYRQLETKNWQHKVGTFGEIAAEIEDINQCIDTICATSKGSVVHSPNLGHSIMPYMDKPINISAPKIKHYLLKDLKIQEPRADFKSVDLKTDADGGLTAVIRYEYQQNAHSREVKIK